jgi:hypothetical protein
MSDPAEIAQKIQSHLRDLAKVDAVFAALPRSEVNRDMFPAQLFVTSKRNG